MSLILIYVKFFTLVCHDITHLPFDRIISCLADHLKRTSNSLSIKWVGNIWLIVGQLPIKAKWWDAPMAIRGLAQAICTISVFSTLTFECFPIFSHISLQLQIRCTHSLTTPQHLKQSYPSFSHPLILYQSVKLRRIFQPLGLDKEISNSPRFLVPFFNTRNKNNKSWSHPESSYLWLNQNNMMRRQLALG